MRIFLTTKVFQTTVISIYGISNTHTAIIYLHSDPRDS